MVLRCSMLWLVISCCLLLQTQGRYNFLESYKRASCVEDGSECFNSGQCCDGFVCTVPNGAPQPNIPGMCVLEKDLASCRMSLDCSKGQRCTSMGKGSSKYCVEGQEERKKGRSGLGADCTTSADCNSDQGLCCKAVNRHVMGVKVMCDREQWTYGKCI